MALFHPISRMDTKRSLQLQFNEWPGSWSLSSLYLSVAPKFPCGVPRDRAPGSPVHGWVSPSSVGCPGSVLTTAGCVDCRAQSPSILTSTHRYSRKAIVAWEGRYGFLIEEGLQLWLSYCRKPLQISQLKNLWKPRVVVQASWKEKQYSLGVCGTLTDSHISGFLEYRCQYWGWVW